MRHDGAETPGECYYSRMTTWQQWLPIAVLVLLGVLVLSDLSGMKRLLRQIHGEMIQTRLASEESDKALVMIQTDTVAMRRLLEEQARDPAARFLRDLGESGTQMP
jgi:hypothetical protein